MYTHENDLNEFLDVSLTLITLPLSLSFQHPECECESQQDSRRERCSALL